jgi:Domain of unknown function (DUF1816)
MQKISYSVPFKRIQEFIGFSLPPKQRHVYWYVEVNISVPPCTCYFGPFDSWKEARNFRSSYVEDLCREGARDVVALVKCREPDILTNENEYYTAQPLI